MTTHHPSKQQTLAASQAAIYMGLLYMLFADEGDAFVHEIAIKILTQDKIDKYKNLLIYFEGLLYQGGYILVNSNDVQLYVEVRPETKYFDEKLYEQYLRLDAKPRNHCTINTYKMRAEEFGENIIKNLKSAGVIICMQSDEAFYVDDIADVETEFLKMMDKIKPDNVDGEGIDCNC